MDGQEGAGYDAILHDSLVFSADGKRVGYIAKRGDRWLVVVDGEGGSGYDGIGKGTLIFSADGKRVAYGAKKGKHAVVVVDGQEGPEVRRNRRWHPDLQR